MSCTFEELTIQRGSSLMTSVTAGLIEESEEANLNCENLSCLQQGLVNENSLLSTLHAKYPNWKSRK